MPSCGPTVGLSRHAPRAARCKIKGKAKVKIIGKIINPLFLVAVILTSCNSFTPMPTVNATDVMETATSLVRTEIVAKQVSIPTATAIIPQETSTVTSSLSSCQIIGKNGQLKVLSDEVFFAGNASEDEINQALVNNYPQWATYQQNVPWNTEPANLSKIVREASYQEKFALNSEVTLVTMGESFNWRLPLDSDLFAHSLLIAEHLVRLWDEFSHPDNEAIRSQYPEVPNGATYALYVFFKFDKEKLQNWCDTYQSLFNTSPMQR